MVKHMTYLISKFILFIFIISNKKTSFVKTILHQSELCQPLDRPCRRGNHEDECFMKYYELNSTLCRDLTFNDSPNESEDAIGTVKFETYHYDLLSYKQTGFNLTFSNISWIDLKFRFKQEGNEMKNTCREFHMSTNSTIENLFYDCLWSNETYEGKTFTFEYEMRKNNIVSYKKYYFKVPFAENIDINTTLEKWEIFLYTELSTNILGLTTFVLHWTPLPEKFFENTYNVTVYKNGFNHSEISFSNVTCTDFKECKFSYNKWYGSVQFGVQPMASTFKKCFMSKTVVFNLGKENTFVLLIGIISMTFIVPALIYIFFLLKNYLIGKSGNWFYSVPKLLLVYTPSIPTHNEVILALVEYLENYCHIEPLIDELHIFQSESRDPFKWCNEAINSADFVMVVPSPNHKDFTVRNSVYRRTDLLLLNLLKEKLSSKDSKTNFFVLMLPYCSVNDVPDQAKNLKRFYFPKHINKMLSYIHKNNIFLRSLGFEMRGGKETYKLYGLKLKNAILETQNNLLKSENELEKMSLEGSSFKNNTLDHSLVANSQSKNEKYMVLEEINQIKDNEQSPQNVFKEFPGCLDDMNLSGDETECLVSNSKKISNNDIINLDVLDL